MTERSFRIILGCVLIALIFTNQERYLACYVAILVFEGVTNFRFPLLISKMRFGDAQYGHAAGPATSVWRFEAERALRIVVALLLYFSLFVFYEQVWFVPWFVGFMLLTAGLTNICPMYMLLRLAGFK